MSKVIARVTTLLDGLFYAKDVEGSLRELIEGDEIYEGEIVVGDELNKPIDSLILTMEDGSNVIVLGAETEIFDLATAENGVVKEPTLFTTDGVEADFAQPNDAKIDVSAELREYEFKETKEDINRLDESEEARRAGEALSKSNLHVASGVDVETDIEVDTDTKIDTDIIEDINQRPTARVETTAVYEDSSVRGTIKFADLDGVATVAVDGTIPTGLTLNPDGSYEFDASSYDSLSDGEIQTIEVPLIVTDDDGATTTTTLNIIITGTNDGITQVTDIDDTLNLIGEHVEQGAYTGITLSAVDIDTDGITYSLPDDVPFRIDADARVVVDGEIDYESQKSYTFDIKATSADGTSSTETVTINVQDLNEAPVAVDDTKGVVTYTMMEFDGDGDYISLGNKLNDVFGKTSSEFSVSAKINPSILLEDETNHYIKNVFMAKAGDSGNDNFELGIDLDGSLLLYLDTKGQTTSKDISDAGDIIIGQDNFVSVTYNDGVLKVNVNGNEYIDDVTWSSSKTNLDTASKVPFTIGASTHFDTYFNGTISSITVHNRELDSSEISIIQNGGVVSSGLSASFDFTSATPLIDLSGNSNDGVIVGDTHQITLQKNVDLSTDEDSVILVDVLANDTDENGDSLFITEIEGQDVTDSNVAIIRDGDNILGTAVVIDGVVEFTPSEYLQNMNKNESTEVIFNYTTSDTKGATDTADVTLTVTGSDESDVSAKIPRLDMSIGSVNIIAGNPETPSAGEGDIQDYKKTIVDETYIGTSKDDSVSVKDGKRDIKGSSIISTAEGNDSVEARNIEDESILNMGVGDDTINIKNKLQENVTVNMGEGNDNISVNSLNVNFSGGVEGGQGYDILTLNNISKADWESNLNGVQDKFINFEKIVLSDGEIVYSHHNTSDTYEYPITLNAGLLDMDGSESLSDITISNLPNDTILRDSSGIEIVANAEGDYVIEIDENGDATATLVSENEIASNLLNDIYASVISTESDGGDTSTTSTTAKIELDGTALDDNIIGSDADELIDGGGGADVIDAGAGNDSIIFDVNDTIDGGEGSDTLVINGSGIELDALDANISNIETINLSEGEQNISSITVEDVLNITDNDNILRIDGDSQDSIKLDDKWKLGEFKTDVDTGQNYQEYIAQTDDGDSVNIEVNTEIIIDED